MISPQSAAVAASIGIAREGHLQRPLATDVAGDGHEWRVTEQAALATGDGERRRLGGDGQVARGHELASGRRRQGVHPGADRLGDGLDWFIIARAHVEDVAGLVERGPGHVPEVVPGGEHRPVGGEDHAAGVGAPDGGERGCQLLHHVDGERVALLRPVEGDGDDVALALDDEVVVGGGVHDPECRAPYRARRNPPSDRAAPRPPTPPHRPGRTPPTGPAAALPTDPAAALPTDPAAPRLPPEHPLRDAAERPATMGPMTPEEAGLVFVTPSAYADEALFHEACAVLRREDPIHLVEAPDFVPFHVITKHADVLEIELHNKEWENAPRPVLSNLEADQRREEQGDLLRTLIHMDDPDHRAYRGVTAEWFLPKNLGKLNTRLAELATQSVDKMVELGGECDFARDIAMQYPLQVILDILGLPESDYPRMLQLTQELFGAADEDLSRGQSLEDLVAVINDFFVYFSALTEERRARPTDDLASAIANATIDGKPLDVMETISYYVIVATAGHDTTASSMAGGLHALVANPDQLRRLQDDPSLIPNAVDEIIRWVTPVKHFMRNATVAYDIGGQHFEPGDPVLLSYPSANRDEDVYSNPFAFDVGRTPNKHLAFGFGVHYCLGAILARMELKALLSELVPRIRSIELTAEPTYMQTLFVGGPKRVPIRYELS